MLSGRFHISIIPLKQRINLLHHFQLVRWSNLKQPNEMITAVPRELKTYRQLLHLTQKKIPERRQKRFFF